MSRRKAAFIKIKRGGSILITVQERFWSGRGMYVENLRCISIGSTADGLSSGPGAAVAMQPYL